MQTRPVDGPIGGQVDGTRRPRVGRRTRWIRRTLVAVAAVVGLAGATFVALGGLADPRDAPAQVGVTDVVVRDDAFGPAVIRVDRGTTVTWTFSDGDEEHNVVGVDGWGAEQPRAAGTFAHAFERSGTYDYQCTLHFNMTGRVEVVDAAPSGS